MPLEMPRVAPRRAHRHHAQAATRADENTDDDDDDRTNSDRTNSDCDAVVEDGGELETRAASCMAMCCAPLRGLTTPVEVGELGSHGVAGQAAFWTWPLFGPLLFENTSSDVRDGLANERTFLSYLRLSMTMAVVAVAIVLSFHLKSAPTALERRMARPLGILFWLLSVLTLVVGVANYINTVNKYSRRQAIVQSGWKTQSSMALVATCILGVCVALLVVNKVSETAG